MSYPKLKFGGRKSTFQCLLKSNVQKTSSYRFARCFAAIPHIPNNFSPIQVYQNSSKIEFSKFQPKIAQNASNFNLKDNENLKKKNEKFQLGDKLGEARQLHSSVWSSTAGAFNRCLELDSNSPKETQQVPKMRIINNNKPTNND